MVRKLITLACAAVLLTWVGFSSHTFAADPIKSLSKKLKTGINQKKISTVGVMNFTYARGRLSTGSYLVSERMLTYLVQNGVPVVERRLMEKVLEEKRLGQTGIIDPESMKEIGKVLGVDTVVLGSLNDVAEDETEIMARMIQVDTGKVLAAGTAYTIRQWHDLPRVPPAAQMRPLIPVAYEPLGMEDEFNMKIAKKEEDAQSQEGTSQRNKGASGPRARYQSAPVPYIPPTSKVFKLGEVQ